MYTSLRSGQHLCECACCYTCCLCWFNAFWTSTEAFSTLVLLIIRCNDENSTHFFRGDYWKSIFQSCRLFSMLIHTILTHSCNWVKCAKWVMTHRWQLTSLVSHTMMVHSSCFSSRFLTCFLSSPLLIERALYCFESSFHPLFNYTQANCRLDYCQTENRYISYNYCVHSRRCYMYTCIHNMHVINYLDVLK